MPADATDDADSQTFFEDDAPARPAGSSVDRVGDASGALGDAASPNVGYTGGLAEGTQSAAGMRQVVVDEATERRRHGTEDEPPANLAQQDQ